MGLLQNGFRDTIGVFRTYGGTVWNNANPYTQQANFHRTGAQRNLTAGEGITDQKVGLPMGYVGKSWQLPNKAGSVSSRAALAALNGQGLVVGGITSPGAASFTVVFADAAGQLISSGSGTASLTFTFDDALLTASLGASGSAALSITGAALLGAEANLTANGTFTITGTLQPYAIGSMSGSTADTSTTVNANIVSVNGYLVTGDGKPGTEWGPN